MSKDRRELEDWEKAECAALRSEVEAYRLANPVNGRKLSQDALGEALGITQGNLSAHLGGKRPLTVALAVRIREKFGIPVEAYSERLARELAEIAKAVQPAGEHAVKASEARGTSYAVPKVLREIAQALADGTLTSEDGEELRRLALHLMAKNRLARPPVAQLPPHLDGLAEAAISTAEQGGNPQDMLKMVEHGLKKSQPKEGPQQYGKRKARST